MFRSFLLVSCAIGFTSNTAHSQTYYYPSSPYYQQSSSPQYVDQKEKIRLQKEFEKQRKEAETEERTKELEAIYQEILKKELHEKTSYKTLASFIAHYRSFFAEKINALDDDHPAIPDLEKLYKNLEVIVSQEIFDTPSFLRKFIKDKSLLAAHDKGKHWVKIPRDGEKVVVSNSFTLDHAILMLLQTSYRIQENCESRKRCLEEELGAFKRIIATLPSSDQKDHLIDIVNQITTSSKKISAETAPVHSILNAIKGFLPTREQTRFSVEVKKEFGHDKSFQKFEKKEEEKEHSPVIIGQYDSSVWKSQEQINKEKKEKEEEERKKAKEAAENKKKEKEEKKEKDPIGSKLEEAGEKLTGQVTKQFEGFLGKLFGGLGG